VRTVSETLEVDEHRVSRTHREHRNTQNGQRLARVELLPHLVLRNRIAGNAERYESAEEDADEGDEPLCVGEIKGIEGGDKRAGPGRDDGEKKAMTGKGEGDQRVAAERRVEGGCE
jgi:hypothetical protein